MKIAKSVAILSALACIGLGLPATPGRAQDNESAPAWVMQGCKALLADPAVAGQPGQRAANSRVSNQAQAETCLSSAQSILTVGGLSGAFCPPSGATAMDAVGVIVSYISARPGAAPGSFRDLATQALIAKWPC